MVVTLLFIIIGLQYQHNLFSISFFKFTVFGSIASSLKYPHMYDCYFFMKSGHLIFLFHYSYYLFFSIKLGDTDVFSFKIGIFSVLHQNRQCLVMSFQALNLNQVIKHEYWLFIINCNLLYYFLFAIYLVFILESFIFS